MNFKNLNLHTFTVFSYILFFSLLVMTFSHPFYLGSLFFIVFITIVLFKGIKGWKRYIVFSLLMAFFITFVNVLVSKNGQTVLYYGPYIPLLGEIMITKESICFGLNMGLKLTVIMSVFYLFELMLEKDRCFSFFSRFFPKSTVLLVLTSSMIPKMRSNLKDISMVMKMRGACFEKRNIFRKIRSSYPLLKILLVSSLEGSWETAEVLNARAYGSGQRTHYTNERFDTKDLFVFTGIMIALFGYILALINNYGFLGFYPSIRGLEKSYNTVNILIILAGLLFLPLIKVIKK